MRGLKVAVLTAATAWAVPAMAGDDAFKQAVNYVFSGNAEGKTPQLVTSIVDGNRCIISVETPGNSWLYYLKEIRPDKIMIFCRMSTRTIRIPSCFVAMLNAPRTRSS